MSALKKVRVDTGEVAVPVVSLRKCDECILQDSPSLFAKQAEALNDFRETENHTDVVLVANDGRRISAHRVILAASIPHFDAMFSSDMVESRNRDVEMKGIESPQALQDIIDYVYTGKLTIHKENVQELLQAANFLTYETVQEKCCRFMQETLELHNSICALIISDKLGLTGMKCCVLEYCVSNITRLLTTQDTGNLMMLSPALFKEVLLHDRCKYQLQNNSSLRESTLAIVLEYACKLPTIQEKSEFLLAAFGSLSLILFSQDFLDEMLVKHSELIQTVPEVREVLKTAKQWIVNSELENSRLEFIFRDKLEVDLNAEVADDESVHSENKFHFNGLLIWLSYVANEEGLTLYLDTEYPYKGENMHKWKAEVNISFKKEGKTGTKTSSTICSSEHYHDICSMTMKEARALMQNGTLEAEVAVVGEMLRFKSVTQVDTSNQDTEERENDEDWVSLARYSY